MLVLALDTCTPLITAAVVSLAAPHELIGDQVRDPAEVLAERTVDDPFGHAEHLMPLALATLQEAGASLRELAAVVVGIGPAPFTGLRVGMATATALGDGLGVPVHGVPGHDGIAGTLAPAAGDFVVVTDARRREIYLSAYQADGRRIAGPDVLAPSAAVEFAGQLPSPPTAIAGPGAELLTPYLALPVLPTGPAGRGLVLAAARGLLTGAIPGPLTPLYLRRPDAVEPAPKQVMP